MLRSKILKIKYLILLTQLSISGLATSVLTAVKNKIPNISNLVKKTDYDTKANEIEKKILDQKHDKYITTPEFNNLAAKKIANS